MVHCMYRKEIHRNTKRMEENGGEGMKIVHSLCGIASGTPRTASPMQGGVGCQGCGTTVPAMAGEILLAATI